MGHSYASDSNERVIHMGCVWILETSTALCIFITIAQSSSSAHSIQSLPSRYKICAKGATIFGSNFLYKREASPFKVQVSMIYMTRVIYSQVAFTRILVGLCVNIGDTTLMVDEGVIISVSVIVSMSMMTGAEGCIVDAYIGLGNETESDGLIPKPSIRVVSSYPVTLGFKDAYAFVTTFRDGSEGAAVIRVVRVSYDMGREGSIFSSITTSPCLTGVGNEYLSATCYSLIVQVSILGKHTFLSVDGMPIYT
jgi:hypothetical protein